MKRRHLRLVHKRDGDHYLAVVNPREEHFFFLRLLTKYLPEDTVTQLDTIGYEGHLEDVLDNIEIDETGFPLRLRRFVIYYSKDSLETDKANKLEGGELLKIPDELTLAVGVSNSKRSYVQRTNFPAEEAINRFNTTSLQNLLLEELYSGRLSEHEIVNLNSPLKRTPNFTLTAAIELPSPKYVIKISSQAFFFWL